MREGVVVRNEPYGVFVNVGARVTGLVHVSELGPEAGFVAYVPGSTSAVSQFDKDDVEAIGLVKFDFLGLATLTILELAKDFITNTLGVDGIR